MAKYQQGKLPDLSPSGLPYLGEVRLGFLAYRIKRLQDKANTQKSPR